jgi:uncharacterized phage protein gp47/JayE
MTKEELFELIKLDFANIYNISVDELGDNFLADSAVLATIEYSLRLRIDEIAANVWAGSADLNTLLIIGFDKIGRLPFPAISGIYTCTTIQIGTETAKIPVGTQFKKGEYVYESLVEIDPGDNIQVRALTEGVESVLAVSDELQSLNPLISIQDIITVSTIDTAPVDGEDIDDYRSDVVNSFTLRPNGGNAADYILWASDVAAIRTVYPYAADGEAGKIKVYCEGLDPFVPISTTIDEVIEAIKYDTEGNGRVLVDLFPFITNTYIVPVQITDINITLNGGDAGQQTEAENVIEDYLYNIRPYLPTLNKIRDPEEDTITQQALIKTLAENDITFTSIILKVKPLGGGEITVTEYQVGDADDPTFYGEIPVLESLTIIP